MSDLKVAIGKIAVSIHENAARHGWWDVAGDEATVKSSKICLMHSELSEATEAIRKPHHDEHCPAFSNEVIELADAVIRIIDYCHRYGLPLADAIEAKHAYNLTRPHKHGGKAI